MSCPFAIGMQRVTCRAMLNWHIPGRAEIHEYCSDGGEHKYRRCERYWKALWNSADAGRKRAGHGGRSIDVGEKVRGRDHVLSEMVG